MGGNLLGDLLQEEVRMRDRIVAIDDEAVLLGALRSRVPFQLMLVPRRPQRALRGRRPDRRRAACTTRCCGCAGRLGASPPLNLWIRTAPQGADTFAGGSTSSRG
jgi:UDPglucose--hexose-1-phosphate uridylyltransferase